MNMHKILVVDDDVDILTLVKMSLQMHNFSVEGLSRWEQVEDCVKSFKPELILLDISLKGADGREICKKLKLADETKHIPIILFSANAELGNTYRECNAEGYIEKPYVLSNMLEKIRASIANAHLFGKN